MDKRTFLKTSGLALGGALISSSLWSCKNKSKGKNIRTAHVGVGNMGLEDLKAIASHPSVEVRFLCDVDSKYLKNAHELFPAAKIYADYREMLQKEYSNIDAVVISAPDHTHAPASLLAMEYNKNIYCQKPLSHYVSESREMRKIANNKGLITQMGIQVHSFYDYKLATLLIQGGLIGKVSKVIAWSNKNWGFNGPKPEGKDPIPKNLDWNLWLGTSKKIEYKDEYYHPGNWRKLLDYGCATLGDMGVHIFDTPYNALQLDVPLKIKNSCSKSTGYGYPERNIVHYFFDGTEYTTNQFEWIWYDGTEGPEKLNELNLPNNDTLPEQGAMFIGENGKRLLLPHFMELPVLIEQQDYIEYDIKDFDPTNELGVPNRDYSSESQKHYHEFIDSCLGISNCSASFDYASRLTETILLGVIAGRFPNQMLHYDKKNSVFEEVEANLFLTGDYRNF